MKTKDILKSPLYLITLVICICFAGAFLVSAFGQDDEIVEKENKKLDDAYFAVLEKFELTEEEIDSCSISYEKIQKMIMKNLAYIKLLLPLMKKSDFLL